MDTSANFVAFTYGEIPKSKERLIENEMIESRNHQHLNNEDVNDSLKKQLPGKSAAAYVHVRGAVMPCRGSARQVLDVRRRRLEATRDSWIKKKVAKKEEDRETRSGQSAEKVGRSPSASSSDEQQSGRYIRTCMPAQQPAKSRLEEERNERFVETSVCYLQPDGLASGLDEIVEKDIEVECKHPVDLIDPQSKIMISQSSSSSLNIAVAKESHLPVMRLRDTEMRETPSDCDASASHLFQNRCQDPRANIPSHLQVAYVTVPEMGVVPFLVLPPFGLKELPMVTAAPEYTSSCKNLPALELLTQLSDDTETEEEARLWKTLEASCKQDLLDARMRRGVTIDVASADSFQSSLSYNGMGYGSLSCSSSCGDDNSRAHSPKPLPCALEGMAKCVKDLVQSALEMPHNVGTADKELTLRGRRTIDQDVTKNRWNQNLETLQKNSIRVQCQASAVGRPVELSPSMKLRLQSGSFGSLASLRTYYMTINKKPSFGTVESKAACESSHASINCSRQCTGMSCVSDTPIDLSMSLPIQTSNKPKRVGSCVTLKDLGVEEIGASISALSSTDASRTDLLGTDSNRMDRSPIIETDSLLSGFESDAGLVHDPSALNACGSSSSWSSSSSSRLSSPSSLPDSCLPPKKRRLQCALPPMTSAAQTASLTESQELEMVRSGGRFPGKADILATSPQSLLSDIQLKSQPKEQSVSRKERQRLYSADVCFRSGGRRPVADFEPNENGDLPLHIVVAQSSESFVQRHIEMMFQLGTSIDSYNNARKTALHLAVINNQPNVVHLLLKSSASPNIPDCYGNNSVHLAILHKNLSCLRCLLIESNCMVDLEARNFDGLTAVHLAIQLGQQDALYMLLGMGANANASDVKNGQTPLHCAAEKNSHAMAKALLAYGANPSSTTYSGRTPAQVASANSHLEMAKMLERNTFSLSNSSVATRKFLHIKEQ